MFIETVLYNPKTKRPANSGSSIFQTLQLFETYFWSVAWKLVRSNLILIFRALGFPKPISVVHILSTTYWSASYRFIISYS